MKGSFTSNDDDVCSYEYLNIGKEITERKQQHIEHPENQIQKLTIRIMEIFTLSLSSLFYL